MDRGGKKGYVCSIETGGKAVQSGEATFITVEKLKASAGDDITSTEFGMNAGENVQVGTPSSKQRSFWHRSGNW
jgi:ribosomal protein L21